MQIINLRPGYYWSTVPPSQVIDALTDSSTDLSIYHLLFMQWAIHSLPIWLILNNSLNFLIYCCMSTRFRNSFKRIFGLQNVCKRFQRPRLEGASDRTGELQNHDYYPCYYR